MDWIDRRFGTPRGAVRLAIAHAQIRTVPPADLGGIQRLVFVCHGNICRSAFAEGLTRKLGFPAASFGLSAGKGNPAHQPIAGAAALRGIALDNHQSTPVALFDPAPGDLYLVMEVRQIARLRADPRFAGARIDLLGRYGGRPHLHDPFQLSAAFVDTSLADIDRAVRNLVSRMASISAPVTA